MNKKFIAAAMAGTMALSLAACGGSSASTGESTAASTSTDTAASSAAGTSAASGSMSVAWWGNQTRNERTQQVLDAYGEANGISFDGQFAEWSDYWNKLATASAGHTLPDVVQMDYSYLQQYVSNGLLVDLTPYVEDGTPARSMASCTPFLWASTFPPSCTTRICWTRTALRSMTT